MKINKSLCTLFAALLFFTITASPNNTNAEPLKLSNRTRSEIKKLAEIEKDMAERQGLFNNIMMLGVFASVLDGISIDDIINITKEDYVEKANACKQLNSIFKKELYDYCMLEAYVQRNSPHDKTFWQTLAQAYIEPSAKVIDINGTWRIEQPSSDYSFLRDLKFKRSGYYYSGEYIMFSNGLEVVSNMDRISIKGDSVEFYIMDGTDQISYILKISDNLSKLTGTEETKNSHNDVVFNKINSQNKKPPAKPSNLKLVTSSGKEVKY